MENSPDFLEVPEKASMTLRADDPNDVINDVPAERHFIKKGVFPTPMKETNENPFTGTGRKIFSPSLFVAI
jgi:hypothetical protein